MMAESTVKSWGYASWAAEIRWIRVDDHAVVELGVLYPHLNNIIGKVTRTHQNTICLDFVNVAIFINIKHQIKSWWIIKVLAKV